MQFWISFIAGTVDASDSQISNVSKLRGTVSESTEVRGQTTASTEDIANVAAGGSKRKKKKRKPPDLPDGAGRRTLSEILYFLGRGV